MSRRPDGSYRCDRCGTDVGGGGIHQCVSVVILNPDDPGDIWHLHFCLPRPDPDDDFATLPGCRDVLFTRRDLADFHQTRS